MTPVKEKFQPPSLIFKYFSWNHRYKPSKGYKRQPSRFHSGLSPKCKVKIGSLGKLLQSQKFPALGAPLWLAAPGAGEFPPFIWMPATSLPLGTFSSPQLSMCWGEYLFSLSFSLFYWREREIKRRKQIQRETRLIETDWGEKKKHQEKEIFPTFSKKRKQI